MKVTQLFPIRPLQSRSDTLLANEVLVVLLNMAGKEHLAAIRNTQPAQVLKYYTAEVVGTMWHCRIVLMCDNKILGDNELVSDLAPRLEKTAQEINFLFKETTLWGEQ